MANYTQSVNSIVGSSYFQGLIMPWDEYVLIPVSETKSILVVGTLDSSDGDTLTFSDSTLYTVDRGSNYNYSYTTSVSTEDLTTVTISEPYYCYSNSLTGAPALNCTSATSVMAYFVCFSVMLLVINQLVGNLIKSLFRGDSND